MSRAKLRKIWSHLPAWGALLLGGGALVSGARADVQPQPPGPPEHQVVVKLDGENIFISQDGSNFEELRLGDTREALLFRKLLRDEVSDGRTVTIPVGSMIVASGGAQGKGSKPPQQPPISGKSGNPK